MLQNRSKSLIPSSMDPSCGSMNNSCPQSYESTLDPTVDHRLCPPTRTVVARPLFRCPGTGQKPGQAPGGGVFGFRLVRALHPHEKENPGLRGVHGACPGKLCAIQCGFSQKETEPTVPRTFNDQ